MADITMCTGGNCPDKLLCYRHTAWANPHRQSYFVEVPYKQGEACVHFGPNDAALKLQKIQKLHTKPT